MYPLQCLNNPHRSRRYRVVTTTGSGLVKQGKESDDPDASTTATTAGVDGRWGCVLPPHPVSWGVELSVKNGVASVSTIVKYGVVVLCSGQRYAFLSLLCRVNVPAVPTRECLRIGE